MTVKYQGVVREIGPMAAELLEAGVLVFFGMSAPAELREISVVHEGEPPLAPLTAGDVITLGTAQVTITGVGSMANANFAELGHIVLKANGLSVTELPGEVSVTFGSLALPNLGDALRIASGEAHTAN